MKSPLPPPNAVSLIEAKMAEMGLKQKDLVELADIPQPTVSAFLSGKRKPSTTFIESVAEVVKISPSVLMEAQATFNAWKKTPDGRRY